MGQLVDALKEDPRNKDRFRREGGQFRYEDLTFLFQDLVATRRTWPDATILVSDSLEEHTYGYLAFWEPSGPVLDFVVPESILVNSRSTLRGMFETAHDRGRLILMVEVEARKFDISLPEEDRPTLWSRLMNDDDLFS